MKKKEDYFNFAKELFIATDVDDNKVVDLAEFINLIETI